MKNIIYSVILTFFTITPVMADEAKFGDYTLNYTVFESTFLQPNIAQQYGFTRSKNKGLLNVALIKERSGKLPLSVPAVVTAKVRNLLGQIVTLEFTTIKEGDAIYYIAPFSKTDDEILKFEITARLNANSPAMTVNTQKHLYVDR
ncbi:DUF4426 domain-containing protein [Marinomonas agarivorans]|nr:DUF4426 domain-containing protein [Marinomonas agarivorans]